MDQETAELLQHEMTSRRASVDRASGNGRFIRLGQVPQVPPADRSRSNPVLPAAMVGGAAGVAGYGVGSAIQPGAVAAPAARVGIADPRMEQLLRVHQTMQKSNQGNVNLDAMTSQHDWRLGSQFDAHGIDKGGVSDIRRLQDILTNGVDPSRPFHTAPFSVDPSLAAGAGAGLGTSGGTAYKTGGFMVLSNPGEQIGKSGIKNVVVNDGWYHAIDDLKRAHPDINFIRADQLQQGLSDVVSRGGRQGVPGVLGRVGRGVQHGLTDMIGKGLRRIHL